MFIEQMDIIKKKQFRMDQKGGEGAVATYNGQGIIFSRVARENPNNEQYRLHVHDDYELLCPTSGRVGYLVEGHS